MLKSISLENYKCFKEKTDIEIAPLTVLCGVNSSGKSSILKSLLMLKQSYENESTNHSLLLTGEYVDNGSFDDVVYHTSKNTISKKAEFSMKFSFSIRDTSNEYGRNIEKRQDIASYKELKRVFYQVKNIKKVKFFNILTEVFVARPNETTSPFEFYIESNIIKEYKIDIELLDHNYRPIDNYKRYIYVKKNADNSNTKGKGWLLDWAGIPSPNGEYTEQSNYPCTCYFSGLQIKNIYADNMISNVIKTLPNLLAIFKIAAFQTDGFNFIAPLRQQPARRYNINGDTDSVGMSGEKAPILLAKEQNNLKTDCIPPFSNEQGDIVWGYEKDSFINNISKWMSYFELGTLTLGGNNGLVEVNINGNNIVDVGFGVSQALPIIVQGLYMTKDQSLLLEQPEIHLHPEMQLQMADFLIALAANEKNVIVETHSDHIINRIVHRVMQNYEELNKLVNIYIVEKENNCSKVRLKIIDKYKGVEKDKNKFFFTQYDSEMTNIIDTGLSNMLEKS